MSGFGTQNVIDFAGYRARQQIIARHSRAPLPYLLWYPGIGFVSSEVRNSQMATGSGVVRMKLSSNHTRSIR
jgi:hypothetical protein